MTVLNNICHPMSTELQYLKIRKINISTRKDSLWQYGIFQKYGKMLDDYLQMP